MITAYAENILSPGNHSQSHGVPDPLLRSHTRAHRPRPLSSSACSMATPMPSLILVRPYERAVFVAVVSLMKNDADAEDVAQEAILKAFKNLARFRQEAKFSTWLILDCDQRSEDEVAERPPAPL